MPRVRYKHNPQPTRDEMKIMIKQQLLQVTMLLNQLGEAYRHINDLEELLQKKKKKDKDNDKDKDTEKVPETPNLAIYLKSWWLTHSKYIINNNIYIMIDTSPWSSCSCQSPWLPCFGHTISSTGPSVSPFRDFFLIKPLFLIIIQKLFFSACKKGRRKSWKGKRCVP